VQKHRVETLDRHRNSIEHKQIHSSQETVLILINITVIFFKPSVL